MLCYKDQTFCTATGCKNTSCTSRMTKQISNDADKWAKDSGLKETPISMTDASEYCLGYMTHTTTNSFGDTVIMGGERVIGVIPKD